MLSPRPTLKSDGERSVTVMSGKEPQPLEANEFQVSAVLPGSAALIGDVAVFNVGGNFCATQARCTHRGGQLIQGKLDGSTVTCPLHGSQFNVCSGGRVARSRNRSADDLPGRRGG